MYGNPKDAANISISINDPAGALFDSGTPVKVSDGYYAWDWEVALTATVGDYSVTWTYIVDSEIKTELQTVTISGNSPQDIAVKLAKLTTHYERELPAASARGTTTCRSANMSTK